MPGTTENDFDAGVTVATKRNDIAVKIDQDVYRGLKTLASWKGISVAKLLSDTMRPIVERELAKIGKDFTKPRRPPTDEPAADQE